MKVCNIEGISPVYRYPHDFIQHIAELYNFPVEKEDTYLSIFDRMLEKFSDQPEHQKAIQELLDFNKKEHEGTDALDTKIWDEDEDTETLYLLLNFKDK